MKFDFIKKRFFMRINFVKTISGLMLIAACLLSASAVFADHAPPNQTAESISYQIENPGNFANIEVINFTEVTATQTVVFAEIDEWCIIAQTPIAVDSGQGYMCSLQNSTVKNSESMDARNKSGGLHKPGTNTN